MFGVNVFRSLLERRVKTENHLSTLAVGVVVNTEIFMSFIKLYFQKQTGYFQQLTFFLFVCFLGHFFGRPYWSAGMKFALYKVLAGITEICKSANEVFLRIENFFTEKRAMQIFFRVAFFLLKKTTEIFKDVSIFSYFLPYDY